MRRIDADRLAAHLAEWKRRLAEAGECGGCAAELIGQVARVVDGWPEADAGDGDPSAPSGHLPCAGEPWGCGRTRTDTQPPRREDADAQGCVLAWDAHGSGWLVRQYKNLQGARWWMPLPGAPE